jgi:hypothetical protein
LDTSCNMFWPASNILVTSAAAIILKMLHRAEQATWFKLRCQ